MRIPDLLNALLVVSGLGAAWLLEKSLLAALIGAVLGYGAILLLNTLYRSMRGRDGIGLGDAKLLAGAGAWLGWTGLPFVVLIAAATGIVFVAGSRVLGRAFARQDAIAFGPFLCIGITAVWLVQTYS
jgi:leader peptidase (prepilin peptidase)/N-methyltransferase